MLNKNNHIRKSICLSRKTLDIAQQHANEFYCGNLSAFLASIILEFNSKQKKHDQENIDKNRSPEN